MIRPILWLAALLTLAPAAAASPRAPDIVTVRMTTSFGTIDIALEAKRAPITTANFLAYVDRKRFDGTTFYRAARSKVKPGDGLVQGGIDRHFFNTLPAIKHEPTTLTGLRHVDGTISMARNDPGTAIGDFFIVLGAAPSLDATKTYPGYAAFGHVVRGMDIVRRILKLKTYPGGFSIDTMGQTIVDPVKIITVRRIG